MSRLEEIRARQKSKSVYSEAMASTDRDYLLALLDEIGKLRDKLRHAPGVESPDFCGCGACADCGYWSGRDTAADELTELLNDD